MTPAGIPPRNGAVKKTQWCLQDHVISAGPNARAGFKHVLPTGPVSHISSGVISPTAMGPNLPQPLCTSSATSSQHYNSGRL